MRGRHFLVVLLLCVSLAACVRYLLSAASPAMESTPYREPGQYASHFAKDIRKKTNSAHSPFALVVEPDEGLEPVLTLVESASSSVDLVAYDMEDLDVETVLVKAASRGVRVRVLLNGGYYGVDDTARNDDAFDYLSVHGVEVRWTPAYFALTHQKSIVVDNNTALVMTFNFVPRYYDTSRDFGVLDSDPSDVDAIERTFSHDWNSDHVMQGQQTQQVLWSPGSKRRILGLIASAHKSLDIYNEEMADKDVVSALVVAAARGVRVRILMTYSKNWRPAFAALADAGVEVRTYGMRSKRYIHAKVIIVDAFKVLVGSQNFSAGSMEENRELGVVLSDARAITRLEALFKNDFNEARKWQTERRL